MSRLFELIPETNSYSSIEEDCSYLLQTRGISDTLENLDSVLSRVVHRIITIDNQISDIDEGFRHDLSALVQERVIVFGTPIMAALNDPTMRSAAACTVIQPKAKNNDIDFDWLFDKSRHPLSCGMGIGYDLSHASDPVFAFHSIDQELLRLDTELVKCKKRPVAAMFTVRANHPRILDFVQSKVKTNFNDCRANISILVDEKLFKKARNNESLELIEQSGNAINKIPARNLLWEISKAAHICGEPGILFKDRLDQENATPHWEYCSTAPCAEIALAHEDVCHLGYINVSTLLTLRNHKFEFDFQRLAHATAVLTRALDNVVEITIKNDSAIGQSMVSATRRIGIGIMGFATLLMQLDMVYGSELSISLAKKIAEVICFYSKWNSMKLAKQRGSFASFSDSRYQEEDWINRKQRFITGIVPPVSWRELIANIKKWGIRNASTVAFPPTGTSSRIVGVSPSFEPYYSLIEYKQITSNGKVFQKPFVPRAIYDALKRAFPEKLIFENVVKSLTNQSSQHFSPVIDLFPQFATAIQLPPDSHLNITCAFENFADGGASKTINLHKTATPEDIMQILWKVYDLGLKGLTIFRDGCLDERAIAAS